jgi:SAM-dependent methyltransferase
MSEAHSRRARSFGGVAGDYREARPGYPQAAVAWLLEHAPGGDVLDLAAGTGKLTEVIAATGARVTAVEPLDGMRRELAATVPSARLLAGSAEQIPLGDGTVDAVLVGQAFHWFDHERALDEIARVLRPRGIAGLIWNLRDEREDWVRRLTSLLDSADVVSAGIDGYAGLLEAHPRFGEVEAGSRPNPEPFDRARLLVWARSTSIVATMTPERADATLAALSALADSHPQLRERTTFEMPYVTFAVRARRDG